MRAMVLDAPRSLLRRDEREDPPPPGPRDLLLRVRACGVCRTDLHIVDGDLPLPRLPLIPGHEIVGEVVRRGAEVTEFREGDRVGVPWLGGTCGACAYCRGGRENLCDRARFTGYHSDGGYAEFAVADSRFVFPLPPGFSDVEAAPLLCAGLIGYRALRLAGEGERVGFYGFGAAAHITAQVARYHGRKVYAFTRPGDTRGQRFARDLGATWAGGSDEAPPEPLDVALIFAPVGPLIPTALGATAKGGTVVCAGIHMSDLPSFPYSILWGERVLRSVAHLTRRDGEEFLSVAARAGLRIVTSTFRLEDANEALGRLRTGPLEGAAVLRPSGTS
ncbi:MAG: zinc-dependent alcohol dehydrogenase family protein [Thermoplasmata archaeon]